MAAIREGPPSGDSELTGLAARKEQTAVRNMCKRRGGAVHFNHHTKTTTARVDAGNTGYLYTIETSGGDTNGRTLLHGKSGCA